MQITIRHELKVALGEGLPRAALHLLMTPQTSSAQTVKEWRIEAPGIDDATGFIDAYGNRAHLCTQSRPEPEMTIVASGIIETHDRNGVVGRLERDPVTALFRRVTPLTKSAVSRAPRGAPREDKNRIALLHDLMARVREALGTETRQSQSHDGQSQSQSAGEIASAADHTHTFIMLARAIDIPARYVTGYLLDEDGAAAFHAWAEAWDEGIGWIGFDAMLGYCPVERHVRVACGLDALSAAPVRSVPSADAPTHVGLTMEAGQ